jgi:hypothetical protein
MIAAVGSFEGSLMNLSLVIAVVHQCYSLDLPGTHSNPPDIPLYVYPPDYAVANLSGLQQCLPFSSYQVSSHYSLDIITSKMFSLSLMQ